LFTGYTLVCATNHGLYARISRNASSTLSYIHEKGGDSVHAEWNLVVDELDKTAKEGGFYSYVAGTAAVVLSHPKYLQAVADCTDRGMRIHNYRTTLPMKKGLSSSAAVCVLVATAFNTLFSLGFTQEELMEIAFQVPFFS
jgi:galactokinase